MNNFGAFFRLFLQENPRALPRAFLAAFGKHPGWNDHIDDVGLETESLILAKQAIYLEGLSSQIDSGAWEKLQPDAVLERFDHLFLWRRGPNAIIGAIVASSDGKGRTRFPMIVCAQFNGTSPARLWHDWWPVLERALQACRTTASAPDVVRILHEARESLRRSTAETVAHGSHAAAVRAPHSLAGQPALGPVDEGLFRLLYQVKNQLDSWAPGRVPKKLDDTTARSVHLRVPQVFSNPAAGLQTWSAFFSSQLDPAAPRLLIWPRKGDWLDLLVGRPAAADFFCLRANSRVLPAVTDVPFALDDSFRERARIVVEDLAGGAHPARSIFDRTVAREAARRRRHGSSSSLRAGRRAWWWIVAALVALLAAGAAVYRSRVWQDELSRKARPAPAPPIQAEPSAPATDRPAGTTAPSASAAPSQAPPFTSAWAELCRTYEIWFGSLLKALADAPRRERWVGVPYLREKVVDPLEAAQRRWGDLDPRKLAGVAGDLRTLRQTPPSALDAPPLQQAVVAVLAVVQQTAAAVREWTILAEIRAGVARLTELGWGKIADEIAFPDKIPFNDRLAFTIDRVLESRATVEELTTAGAAMLDDLRELEGSGDPVLASAGSAMRRHLLGIPKAAELAQAIAAMNSVVEPVVDVLESDWRSGRIARDRFLGERGEDWGAGLGETAQLAAWRLEVGRYAIVSDPDLPLPPQEWEALNRDVEERLGKLESAAGVRATNYRTHLGSLNTAWAELRRAPVLRKDLAAFAATAAQLAQDVGKLREWIDAAITREVRDPPSIP